MLNSANVPLDDPCGGRPATSNGIPNPPRSIGRLVDAEADLTPGSLSTRSSSCS
jgi:hypothetical protein